MMLARLVQSRKLGNLVVFVKLSGIVTLVRFVQPSNAPLSIAVTLSGITNDVSAFPIAYRRRCVPSLLYKFPSIDL